MCSKPVTVCNFIQRGGRIVTAAVLATFLAKDGHYHVLTARPAKKAGAKAFHGKRRKIQIHAFGYLKNEAEHPVGFITFYGCTETGRSLRVFLGVIVVIGVRLENGNYPTLSLFFVHITIH